MIALVKRGAVLAQGIVDRANPLLVRHVRQELRNRGFIGVFMLLLLAAVLASLFMAGIADRQGEGEAGRWLFGLLAVALGFALWVAQPISAFRAMMRERDDDTWDLIDLTGMRPATILRGILQATLVQGALYTAAIAPFMLMAYLLRGLDILTLALTTLGLVLIGVQLSAFAVFWGCLGPNKATRAVLFVLLIVLLLVGWFASWGLVAVIADGRLASRFTIDPVEAWTLVAFWLNNWLCNLVLLLVLAATLLTFRAGNRSTLPRLVWLAIALNGLIWIIAGQAGFSHRTDWFGEASQMVGVWLAIWALPLGLFAATEDRELSPRQARWLREGGILATLGEWCLGPGESRGSLCYLLLAVPALAFAFLGAQLENDWEPALVCAVLLGQLAGYVVLTQLLAAGPLRSLLDTAAARRVWCLGMIIAVTVVQFMVQLVVDDGFPPLNVISPIWSALLVGDEFRRMDDGVRLINTVGVVVVTAGGAGLFIVNALRGLAYTAPKRVRARVGDRDPRGG